MAQKELSSLAVSVFCENMAMMLAAGIGPDEAAGLLCEDSAENAFHDAAKAVQTELLLGEPLGTAVEKSGFFPDYMSRMVSAGERAGRTENVLRSLAAYYDGQNRLYSKLKSAVFYPTLLLVLMAAILAVLLARVLPVFTGVYQSLAGSLSASSYGYIRLASVVGWAALLITLALALALAVGTLLGGSAAGRAKLAGLFERFPLTASAAARMALARFVNVLAIFLASGVDVDSAMEDASKLVSHKALAAKVAAVQKEMAEGAGLASAIHTQPLMEPLYGRMLISGARSGRLDPMLAKLAAAFEDEANASIDGLVDAVEPLLSGFLTVTVGITLVSVMLPLIGILGSIG